MANNCLYDIVKKILDCHSSRESEELLFGIKGLKFNSKEYYEKVITEFGIKKEEIIVSRGENLYFDLDKNKKEIWDLVFLGKKMYVEALNKDDIDKLTLPGSFLDNVSIENVNDSISDDEHLKELKLAIYLIQKLKNSTKHNSHDTYTFSEDKECKLIVDNPGGDMPLKTSIPLRYIQGFNYGNIIPLRDDKIISSEVDEVVYPLLDKLNYDPRNLSNFFYRVNPTLLSYLLEKVDNDVEELYKLPIWVFGYTTKIENLQVLFDRGYGIDTLKKLRNSSSYNLEKVCDLLDLYGIDFVKKLPTGFNHYKEKIISLVGKLGQEKIKQIKNSDLFKDPDFTCWLLKNYDIEDINRLTRDAFSSLSTRKTTFILLKKYGLTINGVNSLYKNYLSLEFDKLFKLLDKYKDVTLITKLPDTFGVSYEELSDFIDKYTLQASSMFHEDVFSYRKQASDLLGLLIVNNHIELAKYLSKDAIENPDNAIAIYEMFNYDKDIISKIPRYAYTDIEKFKELYNLCNDMDILSKLPNDGNINDILDLFREFNNDFNLLKEFPDEIFYNPKSFINLFRSCDKDFELVIRLPKEVFQYSIDNTINLIKELGIHNVLQLPGYACHSMRVCEFFRLFKDIEIVKALPREYYAREEKINIENIELLLENVGEFKESLSQYPYELFSCPREVFEEMYIRYNANLSKSIFGLQNPKIIALIVYMNKVLAKYDREEAEQDSSVFEHLCNNYSGSKEDIGVLCDIFDTFNNSEIVKKEDISREELIKTLTNIENELNKANVSSPYFASIYSSMKKMISSANNKAKNILNKVTVVCNRITGDIKLLNTKYQKTIKDEMVKEIAGIRNSCSHFRIEENGDGKIRVWDKNENGVIMYDRTFSLSELCEFIHEIEILLEASKEKRMLKNKRL